MDDQRPKLSDLYERIGKPSAPKPSDAYPYKGGGPAPAVRRLSRDVLHVQFAVRFCENGCDPYEAYAKVMEPIAGKVSKRRCKNQARKWSMHPRTRQAITAILREGVKRAAETVELDYGKLLQLTEQMVMADVASLLTSTADGRMEWRDPRTLSAEERTTIARVSIDPDTGRINGVLQYDRLAAIRQHVDLLDAARQAGSAGAGELKKLLSQRLRAARDIRAAIQGGGGKVIALEDRHGKAG